MPKPNDYKRPLNEKESYQPHRGFDDGESKL
jgi:hypothetical protein